VRRDQGVSQEELANLADLDRSYVGAVERGERNLGIDNLNRLADALGVPTSALF
jgi:transcriptional regulator with XRE-family HTH domain